VRTIYDGKVVEIKRNRINGKYDVFVAHGEYITSYANMDEVSVEKGQKVAKNSRIGEVGSSVNVTTMESEYKLVFGIYSPNPKETMRAADCFKKK
ncbi:MAG: M23 family metallopeptidase, partial [Alistipes sp.]|nr:M23 family metallopeptidase [Alistipes sp.]